MATADPTMQLYLRLKQEFPELPDNVIVTCVNTYPNDLLTCMSVLSQQCASYAPMYGPVSEMGLNKVDKDHYNHYETSRGYPMPGYRYVGQKSYPGDPIPPAYNPQRRNTFVPPTRANYSRPPTQPQSAPVVPSMYEPFQAEYLAKLAGRSPGRPIPMVMQQPTVYVNDYPSQHQYNQYKYEVALNYNQGTRGSYSLSSSSSIHHHHQSPHKVQAYVNACAAPLEHASIELRAPFEPPRHVTSLNINPVGPHVGLYRFEPRYMSPPSQQQAPVMRSTTINMRLQPPSIHPQPRVQINTSGGGNVVYSATPGPTPTKSHFHISFNRSSGSRTRPFPKAVPASRQCTSIATTTSTTTTATSPCLSAACTCLSLHTFTSSTSSCSVVSGSVTVSSSVLQRVEPSVSSDVGLVNSNDDDDASASRVMALDQNSVEKVSSDENINLSRLEEACDGDVAYVKALVRHQRAQMDRLQQKLNEDRMELDMIRQQVSRMELELYNRIKALKHPAIFNPDEMKILREDIRKLRVECDCMSREVDFLVKGQVPLGETSEDFYKHINPGQSGSVGTPPPSSSSINRRPSATTPISNRNREHDDEGDQWACSQCTFLNNPALNECEICRMPRLPTVADFG